MPCGAAECEHGMSQFRCRMAVFTQFGFGCASVNAVFHTQFGCERGISQARGGRGISQDGYPHTLSKAMCNAGGFRHRRPQPPREQPPREHLPPLAASDPP